MSYLCRIDFKTNQLQNTRNVEHSSHRLQFLDSKFQLLFQPPKPRQFLNVHDIYIYLLAFENPSYPRTNHFYASEMRDTWGETTRSIHRSCIEQSNPSDVSALHRLRNFERPRSPPSCAQSRKERGREMENARAGTPALFQGVARGYVDTWRSATSLSSNVIPFDE